MKKRVRQKRSGRSRWHLHEMSERSRQQQATPTHMPIPIRELPRMEKGSVSVGEMGRWAMRYLEENPGVPEKEVYEEVSKRFIRMQEATDAVRRGDREVARTILLDIVATNPHDLRAKLNLATLQLEDGKGEEAIALLDEIKEAMAPEAQYHILRALSLKALGRRDEMIELLWEAQKAFPNHGGIMEQLQHAGEVIPMGADQDKLQSIQYMRRSQYEEAVRNRIGKLVEERKWKELEDYVSFHRGDQKPALAKEAAEAYLQGRPNEPRALYLNGLCELDLKNWDKAEGLLRAYLESKPEDPKAVVGLALALRRQERHEESRTILDQAIEFDPDNMPAIELAVLGIDTLKERLEYVRALENKYPQAWAPQKAMGDLMFFQDAFEAARVHFEKAISNGGSDECWVMLLNVLGRLNQLGEAVRRIQTITRLQERSSHVRWNAANLLLQAGRVRQASELLRGLVIDSKQPWQTRHSARMLLRNIMDSPPGRT